MNKVTDPQPILFEDQNALHEYCSQQFLEWLQKNPSGLASLPVGKSALPLASYLKKHLSFSQNFTLVLSHRVESLTKTDPCNPWIDLLAPQQIITLPFPFSEKQARTFTSRILKKGGIGFFCSELSQDGSIACDPLFTQHNKPFRLQTINYCNAALAAPDFSGIENIREKQVFSIGPGLFSKQAKVLITASSEDRAKAASAYLNTPLHDKGPLYAVKGACQNIPFIQLQELPENPDPFILTTALNKNKSLDCLEKNDFPFSQNLLKAVPQVKQRLIEKTEKGLNLPRNKQLLHTAPHHDDIMLSYYAAIDPLLQHNHNHFIYVTSGSNAVSDAFLESRLAHKAHNTKSYPELLKAFARAYAKEDTDALQRLEQEMITSHYKNPLQCKAFIRESEVDRLWALKSIFDSITHMRAKFYKDPSLLHEDIQAMAHLLKAQKADILTLAMDPPGTGPSTHHKVLQLIFDALKQVGLPLEVWGYRNVWHRFSLSEATLMIPVTEKELLEQSRAFLCCFSSQVKASFPSPDYDGPFSKVSEKIIREQHAQVQVLLGRDFFLKHPKKEMRQAKGLVFIRSQRFPHDFPS